MRRPICVIVCSCIRDMMETLLHAQTSFLTDSRPSLPDSLMCGKAQRDEPNRSAYGHVLQDTIC